MEEPRGNILSKIVGARILHGDFPQEQKFDISLTASLIETITSHKEENLGGNEVLDARGCLIAPSLCHAHIHLDKCFMLNDSKYSDFEIVEGDFKEALDLTSKAKERFEGDDLFRRGRWLIEESISYGVTHVRAFVEVDYVVEFKCLHAAIQLREHFRKVCHIQICAFAQEPLFTGDHGVRNRELILHALERPEVEVLGATPYVEDAKAKATSNIQWAIKIASEFQKLLDFHLDYTLDTTNPPQIDSLLEELAIHNRNTNKQTPESIQHITLGHCTRLTSLSPNEWHDLSQKCAAFPTGISLIGLPTSDIYIMGKPPSTSGTTTYSDRPRGTLQIPHLIHNNSIPFAFAIAINNVGNAFTPYGTCDPLSVASLGVGIYQAGTKQDANVLYECVSTRAKSAIGIGTDSENGNPFEPGKPADFVLFGNPTYLRTGASPSAAGKAGSGVEGIDGGDRRRRNVQQVVYCPPDDRMTVYRGRLVGTRVTTSRIGNFG